MKTDSIYFAIFWLLEMFLFSSIGGRLFPDTFASYNSLVWAVLCGIAFGVYPWVRPFPRVMPRCYFISVCIHLLTILVASTVVSFAILGASNHFAEWQTTLLLMLVPSTLGGLITLLFSYAKFCFSRHA